MVDQVRSSSDEEEEGGPYRKWLYDRINGKSKYGDRRPPCPICWVPPPVGWCPSIVEENSCCQAIGKLGFEESDPNNPTSLRVWLMGIGFVANTCAFIFTLVACIALSRDYDVLESVAFGSAVVTERSNLIPPVHVHLGLQAVAIDYPDLEGNPRPNSQSVNQTNGTDSFLASGQTTPGEQIIDFEDVCNFPSGLNRLVLEEDCNSCAEASASMTSSVIMSCLSFIPTLSTDILRMFSNYDVNCQKTFATLVAFVSMVGMLNGILQYSIVCFPSFYDGAIAFDADGGVLPNGATEDEIDLVLLVDWSAGPGLICLYTGTLLKIVDIVCNCLIQTPNITRDDKEKRQYESIPAQDDDVEKE